MKLGLRLTMMVVLCAGLGACTEDPTEVSGEATGNDSPGTTGGTMVMTTAPTPATTSESTSSPTTLTTSVDTTQGTVSTTDPMDTTAGTTETSAGTEQMPQMEVVTYEPNRPNEVEDDAYDGSVGSMTCIPLDVLGDGVDIVDGVALQIGMDHDYIGDLVMKLISPAGTIVTLVSRPGDPEPADDGTGAWGDTSNLSAAGPITFVDGGGTDAEQMGSTLNGNSAVCIDDLLCEFDPNPGSAGGGDLAQLNGQDSVGLWRFCVGDSAEPDVGFVHFVELRIDQVP